MTDKSTTRIIPPVGMRMIKSAVAVLICLLASMLLNREDMRVYASIAALLCVQPYADDTKRMAIQRATGTVIGSVFGISVLMLEISVLHIHGTLEGYIFLAAFIIPVIWMSVVLRASNAAALSGIVFLSITVTQLENAVPWIFAWQRVSETLLGIAVGIAVNAFQLPRRKQRDVLFVSELDGVLLAQNETLPPSAVVQINRMLDDGLKLTISTRHTNAFIQENLHDLRLQLPLIVMDGAAIYDMKEKRYLHTHVIPKEFVLQCEEIFAAQNAQCFLNGVLENNLVIYYGEFRNEAERDIFKKLRTSPYRNYVSRRHYQNCPILYIMAIERTERTAAILDALRSAGLLQKLRVRVYPAAAYPGYSYIRIYEASASRETMLTVLKEELSMPESVLLTAHEDSGDVRITGGTNQAVKKLAALYAPYILQRRQTKNK